MSAEQPQGGGGGIMSSKIMGMPTIVVVGVVAVVAYFLFFRKSSASAGSPSTSGGGGTATSGNTTIDKGAIQVTVKQGNPQPRPHVRPFKTQWHTHPTIPPRKKGAPHPAKKKTLHTVHRKPATKKTPSGLNPQPENHKKKKKPVLTN